MTPRELALAGMVVAGLAFLGLGVRTIARVAPFLWTVESRIGEVTAPDGPVKIGAWATRDGPTDLVTAPLSGQECLVYSYEIQQLANGAWATIGSGVVGGPLLIGDGSGTARIDPTDATPDLHHTTRTASWADPFQPDLQEYVPENRDTGSRLLDWYLALVIPKKLRFVEGRIEEGQFVTVYGESRRAEPVRPGTPTPDFAIGAGPGANSFVITDGSWWHTAWKFGRRGLGYLLIGLVCLGMGLWFLFVE